LRIEAEAEKAINAAKTEADKKVESYVKALKESEQKLKALEETRAKTAEQLATQEKAAQEAQTRARAEEKRRIEAEKLVVAKEKTTLTPQVPEKTGECECCGRKDIKISDLVKIDSGQMFCRDCLKELRG
jgi:hypothetical protein